MKKISCFFVLMLINVTLTAQTLQHSWRYYRPGNTGIQGDYATALWIDDQGNPYLAANTGNWGEGGIAKLEQSENRWLNYSNVDYPILGSFDNGEVQIFDIVKDPFHNLWMGNFTGALRFDPDAGIPSMEKFDQANSELLGFTYDIDIAPDSSVWFTSGGLVQFKPQSNQWSSWPGSNTRIAVQPKPDGSYLVWSADVYYGYVFTYNSVTNEMSEYLPSVSGEIAGLPGKDCTDDAGNFWALRMADNGDWETLEYQKPDGSWIYPEHPYANVSFYIDAFKAFGNEQALLVTTTGETWFFDGSFWHNYGTWRPGEFTLAVDADSEGNVWVCGIGGAAKRDAATGIWQRYRITNTSQIDYFVEDLSLDNEGNVWLTGNAGTGAGGFQKFDGQRWTGFNEYTYGLGYPFPYQADNTQAILRRPSNGHVVFNPTFNGIHAWDGETYYPIEDLLTTSGGFTEDSWTRLWSLEEYGGLRYYNDNTSQWAYVPLVGWGLYIRPDPILPGTIWAITDNQMLRTDGNNSFSRTVGDFPVTAAWFTGFATDEAGIVWIGTWSQFTSTGSTLIRLDSNTGLFETWEYDQGWPFPGEHVRPMAVTPDGRLWLQYDSEYPSDEAGLCWFDGENVGVFPASPGGVPAWGVMPNSSIRKVEVRIKNGGYELWMSCLGRGIAVLEIVTEPVDVTESEMPDNEINMKIYPNPAVNEVTINVYTESNSKNHISVFNVQGQKIRDLTAEIISDGHFQSVWDLLDVSGSRVRSGVYYLSARNQGDTKTLKMVVR